MLPAGRFGPVKYPNPNVNIMFQKIHSLKISSSLNYETSLKRGVLVRLGSKLKVDVFELDIIRRSYNFFMLCFNMGK